MASAKRLLRWIGEKKGIGRVLKKVAVALTATPIFWLVFQLPNVYPGLVIYTIISLSTEAIFTGLGDQVRRLFQRTGIDWVLPCRTYLWAVIVYGLSGAISFPLMDVFFPKFYGLHWAIRGAVFPIGIFAWEFYWGWYIETLFKKVPWEYQHSTYRIWRYIKPRYCLFWSGFGFVLEWTHLHVIHRLDHILPIVFGP